MAVPPPNNKPTDNRQPTSPIQVVSETIHGPLPPPEMFAGYNQVLSGSAHRILTMAEAE